MGTMRNRLLLAILCIAMILSFGYTYYKTVVAGDFTVTESVEEEVVEEETETSEEVETETEPIVESEIN